MNHELITVIDQISKEKGIAKDVLLEAVESALVSAARRKFPDNENIAVKINPKNGTISINLIVKVVEEVEDLNNEMTVDEARELDPSAEVGSEIILEQDFEGYGRIAAQTAKQVIVQRVKEAERDIIVNEYSGRIGDLVNGIVMRQEKGNYIIDIGKTEAILPVREQAPRESYKQGDRIRAYLLDVRTTNKGPQIVLSRSHPDLVAKLFEMEVPEIYEGIVEIKGAVREAGDRTKIAVVSKDSAVDPVGACVGMKGSRVQAVVRELRGEKIDIIPWTQEPVTFISKALSPATIEKVAVDEDEKSALVIVTDSQLSLAIGKKGQNVRLAAKLTGWKIDIYSETEYDKMTQKDREKEIEEAIARESRLLEESQREQPKMEDIPGLTAKTAEKLRLAGLDDLEKLSQATMEELTAMDGIGEKTARLIMDGAKSLLGQ
ncbi:MAG TPA: transcription termination factor NusA [Nitrospirota bacterium]|nr:transcription termination factor NusA [Nitrospirota bacterium]